MDRWVIEGASDPAVVYIDYYRWYGDLSGLALLFVDRYDLARGTLRTQHTNDTILGVF